MAASRAKGARRSRGYDVSFGVKAALSVEVGRVRILGRIESAEISFSAAGADGCDVLSLGWGSTDETGFAVSVRPMPVVNIDAMADISEVFNPVISPIAVDVVDLSIWPFAVDHQPCQPVRLDLLSAKCDHHVPVTIHSSGSITGLGPPSQSDTVEPNELAGLWVVGKWDIHGSHTTISHKEGRHER